MDRTFILTAELDPASFNWLDGLRRAHFPPARNMLNAHLTLFHRLSLAQASRLADVDLPAGVMPMHCDGVRLLGFGVAIEISCPELARLRTALRIAMGGELSRQDSQGWRPHVTIQNKVTAAAARGLYDELRASFVPRAGAVGGLLVWEYLNGPWRLDRRLPFNS
ncbi:2'-5' RNA ligase family protein [Bradyrhizobium amphicarpaeae]|nr:2'-5' RNA ligase family protein [Bradyrhizobium amphicarpaeae]